MKTFNWLIFFVGIFFIIANTTYAVQVINTHEIADGAVTDVKIMGPISASKIEAGFFATKVENVVVVAKSGGDYSDLGLAIDYVIANIGPYDKYLLKIMPGTYFTYNKTIPSNVTIEGSGMDSTIIESYARYDAIGGTSSPAFTLSGSNIEVRNLTMRYEPYSPYNQFHKTTNAIVLSVIGNALVENVKITALTSGLGKDTLGISAKDGNITLRNVDAIFSPYIEYVMTLNNCDAWIDSFYTKGDNVDLYPIVKILSDNTSLNEVRIKNSVFGRLIADSIDSLLRVDINTSEIRYLNVGINSDIKLKNTQMDYIYDLGGSYKHINCFTKNLDNNIIIY